MTQISLVVAVDSPPVATATVVPRRSPMVANVVAVVTVVAAVRPPPPLLRLERSALVAADPVRVVAVGTKKNFFLLKTN